MLSSSTPKSADSRNIKCTPISAQLANLRWILCCAFLSRHFHQTITTRWSGTLKWYFLFHLTLSLSGKRPWLCLVSGNQRGPQNVRVQTTSQTGRQVTEKKQKTARYSWDFWGCEPSFPQADDGRSLVCSFLRTVRSCVEIDGQNSMN